MILAIDPGTEQSGWVLYTGEHVYRADVTSNTVFSSIMTNAAIQQVVIERFASYGMAIGQTTIDAIHWGGRFHQQAQALGYSVHLVFRRDIKLYFCSSPRANDATVRQAIFDLYGGREKALGTKKNPGPLYGVKADAWSALALALYHHHTIDFQA